MMNGFEQSARFDGLMEVAGRPEHHGFLGGAVDS
jgi:hypothetical protein